MKKRILVVDDEPSCGALLQRVMPAYNLKHETNPERTLEVAMSFQPHLFILDLKMPDLAGDEVADAIRRDPCFKNVPIIFVSASIWIPDDEDEPTFLHGCLAFPKPFRIERLRAYVAVEIARAESTRPELRLLDRAESTPQGKRAGV